MQLHQRKPNQTASSYDSDHPKSPKPQKRWSLACNTIYFIVYLSKKILPKNTQLISGIVRSPSYVALNVEDADRQARVSFSIDQKSLTEMTRERDIESLSQLGGVRHLALMLGTNITLGLSNNNDTDILRRKDAYGSNVYQKPPRKSFFNFLLEAFKDTTVVILLFCAVLALGFGIKGDGPKEGWYDGGSIIVAIFLVVSISAISNSKQSLQFEKLTDKSSEIQVEVLRDGRRQRISIFELLVGDIVFLNIGDQIPADGLFLEGHSLKVDESSMTGESEQVEVNDENAPFLFSGTKVLDGYGRMLVTSLVLARPGVREAVTSCRNAGVHVKMITGDNLFTAKAIGVECGILDPDVESQDEAVIEGRQFRNYSHEERMEKIDGIRIMARSSPLDKLLMVICLKQKGHVVAVTGDGTNDAPALKQADIGLSMGIQGTEVAKESSDIVILDDNFASVVTVLRWGRCVYNNIQKFIQFQLTVNIAALTINFVAAVSSGNVPLTAVQLLWVNLIMDTLGALALATEQPTDDCMKQRPVGRTEPLITKIMWRNLIAQALYQIAILLTLQFKGKSIFKVDERVKDTLIFNCFVLCQVFNEFNARKLEKKNIFEGILRNRLFLGIIGLTIVLQIAMVEFLKKFASTARLNWGQWGACIAIAAVTWLIGWLVKCIPISKRRHLFAPT